MQADSIVIDIGNTRTKVGIFIQSMMLVVQYFDGLPIAQIKEYLKEYDYIQRCITCSVSHDTELLSKELEKMGMFVVQMNAHTPLPIRIAYRSPQTLGADRIASIMGAHAMYPNKNMLVIDAGTCVTYDVLTANNRYLGGYISPGLQMRLDAMHHFTKRLPQVPIQENTEIYIGGTTEESMWGGAEKGLLYEIEGIIDQFKMSLMNLNIILTGGDAANISKSLKSKIILNQNLVLVGLNKILMWNVSEK